MMMKLARYALVIPAIIVMAYYIPLGFDVMFGERVKTTHMFYSPVLEKFVWRDMLRKSSSEAIEDVHHAQFIQEDETGKRYTREEFERLIPFIYYKNMELWGELPLKLKGQTFDKKSIKSSRQVTEFKPVEVAGNTPTDQLLPLMEAQSGIARIVFPEDRVRLNDRFEFVNADYNQIDENATIVFTKAMEDQGFVFPGRLMASKPTILKPFDEGIFAVDSKGVLFHIKRQNGQPYIFRTPVNPPSPIRSLRIAENKRKEYYGLLLTQDDSLYLMTYDNYALIKLPVDGYDPDTMKFKLVVNPLYRTATFADDEIIRAVAMDSEYKPIATCEHVMPGSQKLWSERLFACLVPFRLDLQSANSGYLGFHVNTSGWRAILAIALALALYRFFIFPRSNACTRKADLALVVLTGLYGLVAVSLLPNEE